MNEYFSWKGLFWYLVGFGVLTMMIAGLMQNGAKIPLTIKKVQMYHSFQYRHKISELKEGHKNTSNIKDTLKSLNLEEYLKTLYYPGENIPVSKTNEMHKLSHKILKRRLSPEEYNNYKELLFGVIDIFNEKN